MCAEDKTFERRIKIIKLRRHYEIHMNKKKKKNTIHTNNQRDASGKKRMAFISSLWYKP